MTGEVRLVRSIRATRAELWQACSTAPGLELWYADRVAGALVRGATVTLSWPALGASIELQVIELVTGQRIVFASGNSRVILEIGEGTISLEHNGLAEDDDVEGLESSWRVALAVLTHALEMHRGVARRTRWITCRARVKPEVAHLWFTEPRALETWFGRDVVLGAERQPYSFLLGSGEPMSGRVLTRIEGRDLALSWRERRDSVLVFRTLPSPEREGERLLALYWSAWGPADPGEQTLEREFRRALEHLAAILAAPGSA